MEKRYLILSLQDGTYTDFSWDLSVKQDKQKFWTEKIYLAESKKSLTLLAPGGGPYGPPW